MNYNHLLSGGHVDHLRKIDPISSQGSSMLGQKRSHDQLVDGPEGVAARRSRLATDSFTAGSYPCGPQHIASFLSPWGNNSSLSSSSHPLFDLGQFDRLCQPNSLRTCMMGANVDRCKNENVGYGHNSELGVELTLLNHPGGIPSLLRGPAKFAGMDATDETTNLQRFNETNRLLDSILTKGMYPSCSSYNNSNHNIGENGFLDSDISRQLFPGYGGIEKEAENMRQALGKEVNRSVAETTCQDAGSKFTLMGEPVEKSVETGSSDGLQKMRPQAPYLGTSPHGLFSDFNSIPTGYATNLAGLSPEKVHESPGLHPRSYSSSAPSRGFYQSSLANQCGRNSMLFGLPPRSLLDLCGSSSIMNDPSANFHEALGLKMGRHMGPGALLSFEARNAAINEYLLKTLKSPAEPGTSKAGCKSGAVRRREKDNSNIFPANVKSLLSTGIFDGVPVKYVSWDRSKNVRGTIQGTGYLCWCADCNKTKMVNAYQLEQHAGSKSKHPNDHIYFSNGKSIYGVVQELKNTPSDKLLEVIPTVTGSGINEANFTKWKESFQAAGRELNRIFGSDHADTQSQDVGLLAA